MRNFSIKRFTASLLLIVMLVAAVPATLFDFAIKASAADTVLDAAIFCSDVHGSTSDLSSVLAGVKTSGVTYSSIGFVGDTCLTVSNTTSIVNSALGYTPSVMFSYASSHDTEGGADISTNWDYSGEVEGVSNYYLVYTIRETDMQNDNGAEADFTSWYNGLADAKKKLPIFIMSHRPLHARRNDNAGAAAWYDAISAAADSSDIVFFWGHNHTNEDDVDIAAYYVAKDGTESFTVYNGDTVFPNFTYMNAGYINANNQNPARKGIATTVKITADSLIFQDYNSSGEYTGNYAHNVTVAREFAETKTVTGIDVTGTTRYTVGGNGLELTVTATYDDGTTADVTADATFSPAELTASGVYTVTATYGGFPDTIDVKVYLYDEDDNGLLSVEAFSQGATALEVTWDDAAEEFLDDLYTDYVVYDLALTNPGESTEYAMSLADGMDITNLAVYHVADDGTLTLVPHTIENDCVVFTTSLTGTFAYGSIKVPDGYTLSSITLAGIPKDIFVGGSLDLMNAVITATYTKEGAEDFVRQLTVYDYDEKNFSGYDVNVAGKQTAVFTFEGKTATMDVYVWGDEFTADDVTVKLDTENGSEYGVTDVIVGESTNANVADAISGVITGTNYVAYDISLSFAEGYTGINAPKTVTLPIPDGVTNPSVYYVSDNGSLVIDMEATNNDDGTVSFETTHFSTYVVGETTEIEVPENKTEEGSNTVTTTESKEVYVLVSSISGAGDYLIVNTNSATTSANLLTASYNGVTNTSDVTITTGTDANGNTVTYIEDPAAAAIWTAAVSGSGYTLRNSSTNRYLRYSNSSFTTSSNNSTTWYSGTNTVYKTDSTRYIRYNNGWATSSSSQTVYIYQKQTVNFATTTTVSGTYSIDGEDKTVAAIKGVTVDLSAVLNFAPTSGNATTEDVSTTATYKIVTVDANGNTVNGDPLGVISGISGNTVTLSGNPGKALVKVSYTTDFGEVTDYVTISATTPDHYSIELHEVELQEATGVTADNFSSGTYYTYDSKTGFYTKATAFAEGTTYYTNTFVQGEVIDDVVVLKGVEGGEIFAVWAVVKAYATEDDTEGVDLGELGDSLTWTVSDESIATIDPVTGVITFTGKNYGTFTVTVRYTGADGKPCEDEITISVTESLYTVPGDGTNDFPEYPNEGAVRFDKTATAVGNFSETGITKVELSMTGVPYSTGSEIDVVLMLDMTGSMSDDAMVAAEEAAVAFVAQIVKNEDGTYNKNRIAVYAFNSGSDSPYELVSLKTITSDEELATANTAIRTASDKQVSGGTPYDEALEKCQSVLSAAKTTNLPDGVTSAEDYERQQFCVFMSDGGPTSYQYITNYDAVKAGTATAYTTSSATATGGSGQSDSNFATIATYTHEYYSTLMKDDGVTMFSVLTGLSAEDYPNCATILENIASSSDNAYVVESGSDTSAVTGALSSIAQKIVEAAKDVVVEDKIGNNFSVNFSLPGYGTDYALGADALDGLSEFYIQVVEYQLDANKERTGDPTVLENFTFNQDGTLKSHTVDGVACSGCSHVTITDGVITKIDGTYFDYERKTETENGKTIDAEYLTWTADKLTTTELALQYFAWLDNSSGVSADQQVPADTYYTNEYATLTYTNFQGNRVQQEMPVPQMTWNGAQVSYVFYLVNEQGQPVNRAGKVVPFAEAVYVTDIYTKEVIWNDLEQLASLDAAFLAGELVPDVYELYDDDATYFIHVYENENEVNLNNHFVIGGDVTDDYNTVTNSRTNANTTIVFNTKAGTRYYTVGTYVADDGDNSSGESGLSYLCKGDGTISGVDFDEDSSANIDSFATNVYYTLENGKYKRALHYSEGNTYYKLIAASYTAVDGETQVPATEMKSTSGGTVIDGYVYYVDENGAVYTIVRKSNGIEVEAGFDFSNTTVAFAVVWKPELKKDIVVIDYGLDVVIDVITNDTMIAEVTGVMTDAPTVGEEGTYDNSVNKTTIENALYKVAIEANSMKHIRFTQITMGISGAITFYYEAKVEYYQDEELKETYMYSSVTVIPATTIYYEEKFVNFFNAGNNTDTPDGYTTGIESTENKGIWVLDGTYTGGTQDQDRPGDYSLLGDEIDHNNVYGYDGIYSSSTTYSLGSAAKVTVDSDNNKLTTAPHAVFTFTGTGFDLISLTDNTSGAIALRVLDENGTELKDYRTYINNYYGCKYENGEWIVDESSTDCIYQVPVVKISGLTHGTYTVELYVQYATAYDLTGDGQYTFVLDSIRIYDPAQNCNDTYVEDGEGYPHYLMVKEAILGRDDLENLSTDITGTLNGSVFIDGMDSTSNAADYSNPGPNNEAYLAPGQSISFKLTANTTPVDVQLGAKLAYGDSVDVKIIVGENSKTLTIETATDMYYSIMDCLGKEWTTTDTITIVNSATDSNNLLSLTNIKATFESATTVSGSEGIITTSATASTGVYSLMSARMVNLETVAEEEPVSISFLVDAEVIEDACAVMTALYAPEPEIFTPEVLEHTVISGWFGINTVRVITSKDVASVTVNGVEATKLNDSKIVKTMLKLLDKLTGTKNAAGDYYIWTVTAKRADSYEIVAYNAEGIPSDPALAESAINVGNNGVANSINREEIEKILKAIAEQHFDPEQFNAEFNKRFDGKTEIVVETSDDVSYVIIGGKIVKRYITETVIDTETGETTTKRVWITDAEEDEEVEVNVYDENGVGSESKKMGRKGDEENKKNEETSKENTKEAPAATEKPNENAPEETTDVAPNTNNKKNNGKSFIAKFFNM